jgi:hypothetical protein
MEPAAAASDTAEMRRISADDDWCAPIPDQQTKICRNAECMPDAAIRWWNSAHAAHNSHML